MACSRALRSPRSRWASTPPACCRATTRIVHGTTVATNALLEGKAARVGMLTTEGHRDVIEMREGLKPDRYNLRMAPPDPLVPRRLRLPVRERMRADGSIETALDPASLDRAVAQLAAEGVQAVAVCFLHAWRNPAHEQTAAAAVRARLQQAYVTASSDVLPQIKEFERFSTTVANAAVGPVIENYLGRLQTRLGEAGYRGELLVILSHGGVASVAEAIRLAAGTALSGPAGGVAAAVALARAGVARDLIAFDMGGTSTDIALVRGGEPTLSGGKTVANARIALPGLDIVTLGAGGGSIGQRRPGGAAGGGAGERRRRSGSRVLRPGRHRGDGDRCQSGAGLSRSGEFSRRAAAAGRGGGDRGGAARRRWRCGCSIAEAAFGIHRLVNTRMADGVRVATVRRGVDPRGFALLAFGGAAGLHVAAVAAELGIGRVVVPVAASVLSAWGMLNTDLRIELMRSQSQTHGIDVAALRAAFAAMEREGRARLAWFDGEVTVRRSADMRYGEQVFEIAVDLEGVDWEAPDLAARIEAAFHGRTRRSTPIRSPDQDVVLVNARASVDRAAAGGCWRCGGQRQREPAAPKGRRRVWLGGWTEVPVFDFAALAADQALAGPAIVEVRHDDGAAACRRRGAVRCARLAGCGGGIGRAT